MKGQSLALAHRLIKQGQTGPKHGCHDGTTELGIIRGYFSWLATVWCCVITPYAGEEPNGKQHGHSSANNGDKLLKTRFLSAKSLRPGHYIHIGSRWNITFYSALTNRPFYVRLKWNLIEIQMRVIGKSWGWLWEEKHFDSTLGPTSPVIWTLPHRQ